MLVCRPPAGRSHGRCRRLCPRGKPTVVERAFPRAHRSRPVGRGFSRRIWVAAWSREAWDVRSTPWVQPISRADGVGLPLVACCARGFLLVSARRYADEVLRRQLEVLVGSKVSPLVAIRGLSDEQCFLLVGSPVLRRYFGEVLLSGAGIEGAALCDAFWAACGDSVTPEGRDDIVDRVRGWFASGCPGGSSPSASGWVRIHSAVSDQVRSR